MNDEGGQAMSEFALAAAAALLLLIGCVEFARALFTYELVSNAARLGARYAIVHGSACALAGCPASAADVQAYVDGQVSSAISTGPLTVTTTWSAKAGCTASPFQGPGCLVSVNVRYPFQFMAFGWHAVTLSSTSAMTISQ